MRAVLLGAYPKRQLAPNTVQYQEADTCSLTIEQGWSLAYVCDQLCMRERAREVAVFIYPSSSTESA